MVKSKGLSLLEILVAMLVFMTVIAVFGMVFPSGLHLNLKSFRQNQAVSLANAILQEVASKPVYAFPYCPTHDCPAGSCTCPNPTHGCVCPNPGDSLFQISSVRPLPCPPPGPYNTANCWTPDSFVKFAADNPLVAREYGYSIPNNGIDVEFFSGGNPDQINDNPIVRITVRLNWIDRQVPGSPARTTTLTTMVTHGE